MIAYVDSQQILSYMDETGAYTEAVLEPYRQRLGTLKQIVKQDSEDGKHPEPIVRLMKRKLDAVGGLPLARTDFKPLTHCRTSA